MNTVTTAPVDANLPESVIAPIAYLNHEWRDRDELPRIYSRATRHANTSKLDVEIHNARLRQAAGDLSLDTSGFMLIEHETAFAAWEDKKAIESAYFEEMRTLTLALTGARDAMIFPFYQVRSRRPANFFDAYALYVHCDFTPHRWMDFAQDIIQKNGGGKSYPRDEYEFALYNLWRPIYHAAERDPLALMDASTVDPNDIVEYRLAPDRDESLAALPVRNEDQQFYYFPNMQTNEVLMFKQQDSRADVAQVCPHTSFIDPNSDPAALERRSIEVRVLCVYDKV